MRHVAFLLVPWLLLTCAQAARAQDGLASAQALYAAAQYEDALKAFDALKSGANPAPGAALTIERGRALCLLALDRKADAQQSIEVILDLDPFYQPGEDDAAPKIRAAFRDVRRRALPGLIQQVYSRAKEAYDRKDFGSAATGFTRVLSLLDDPDLTLEPGARADMRMVAKAFGDLAHAAAAPPPAPAAKPAPDSPGAGGVPPAGSSPPASPTRAVYDASSADVTPPEALRKDVRIPDTMRPTGMAREVVVEVVVAANGSVESAELRQSAETLYGALVARAAMDWRYKPATRAGVAVRYRMLVKVVIAPVGGNRDAAPSQRGT